MRYNQMSLAVMALIYLSQNTIVYGEGSPTEENEDDSFLHIDSNNDKVITREEMTEYLKKMESSKEGDPPTDPEEMKKEHETLIKEIFETKDLDKDDHLSFQELLDEGEGEMEEEQQSELEAIDKNGDKKLSREELINYLEEEHNHEGDNEPMDEDEREEHIDDFFEKQDIDKDGVVSYEEFNSKHDEL